MKGFLFVHLFLHCIGHWLRLRLLLWLGLLLLWHGRLLLGKRVGHDKGESRRRLDIHLDSRVSDSS